MSEYPVMARGGFSGSAIAALVLSSLSMAAIATLPAAVLPLGGVATVLGFLSRGSSSVLWGCSLVERYRYF